MTTPRILVDKETGEEFEVERSRVTLSGNGFTAALYPIPKPEKSLEEELRAQGFSLTMWDQTLCRILDRRLKELKK